MGFPWHFSPLSLVYISTSSILYSLLHRLPQLPTPIFINPHSPARPRDYLRRGDRKHLNSYRMGTRAEKRRRLVGRAWLSHWWIHGSYNCSHKACTQSNQPKAPKKMEQKTGYLTHCPVTKVEKQTFLGIFITLILQEEGLSCSDRIVTGFGVRVKSVLWNQTVLQAGP